jgi:apolipoprotein N-acyltransferase
MILPGASIRIKGTTGLLVTAIIMIAVLIAFPAYRVFFAISVALGILVAAVLYLRNKYRPITDKDVENKRPLGLD